MSEQAPHPHTVLINNQIRTLRLIETGIRELIEELETFKRQSFLEGRLAGWAPSVIQRQALRLTRTAVRMTSRRLSDVLDVELAEARDAFQQLADQGLVERHGVGRGTDYTLTELGRQASAEMGGAELDLHDARAILKDTISDPDELDAQSQRYLEIMQNLTRRSAPAEPTGLNGHGTPFTLETDPLPMRILELAATNPPATTRKLMDTFHLTRRKAQRELRQLVQAGELIRKGRGRGTYFVLPMGT